MHSWNVFLHAISLKLIEADHHSKHKMSPFFAVYQEHLSTEQLCIQSPWGFQPIHPNPSWGGGWARWEGGLSSMGGLLLTGMMHHIPLMPPMFCPLRLCNLVWPRVWGLTGANDHLISWTWQQRISWGRVTYSLADFIITSEPSQIALLEFLYPDLSCLVFYSRAIWRQ